MTSIPTTPDNPGLRDLWLSEMWPVCREVPREQREIDREIAAERTRSSTRPAA